LSYHFCVITAVVSHIPLCLDWKSTAQKLEKTPRQAVWKQFFITSVYIYSFLYSLRSVKSGLRSSSPLTLSRGSRGHQHGHKFLSKNTVTWRPITDSRQHRTTATLSKAFHEEPGH